MQLKKVFTQNIMGTDCPESDLIITVNYNPQEKTVEEIISVQVFNHRKNCFTDITAIMAELFESQLNDMIDSDIMQWDELYNDTKPVLHPVFQDLFETMGNIFKPVYKA